MHCSESESCSYSHVRLSYSFQRNLLFDSSMVRTLTSSYCSVEYSVSSDRSMLLSALAHKDLVFRITNTAVEYARYRSPRVTYRLALRSLLLASPTSYLQTWTDVGHTCRRRDQRLQCNVSCRQNHVDEKRTCILAYLTSESREGVRVL